MDALVAATAWLGLTYLRFQSQRPINEFWNYQVAMMFVVLWWWIANAMMDLYSRPLEIAPLKQGKDLVKASCLFAMGMMSFGYLSKETLDPGRSVVLGICALNPVLLFCSRAMVRSIEMFLRRKGYGRVRTLLVGCGELAEETWNRLTKKTVREHQVVGVLHPKSKPDQVPGFVPRELVGTIDQLEKILEAGGIDLVVFADEETDQTETLNLIANLPNSHHVHYRIACNDMSTVMINRSAGVEEIDGIPVIHLASANPHIGYKFLKRALDLLVVFCLIPLALPVCLVAIPLIRWKSGGTALFWQKRLGLEGKEFWMVKLRTMRLNVDEYGEAPRGPGDPRVLGWLGTWLRRTSLDEIPQLYNVLKGDMTLVGPRPEMPNIAAGYAPWQRRRLMVKPGVTGLWQILGRKNLPLQANLEYDFFYIQNQSFLLDLVILIRTIPVVLFGKGAF
jgi:exopolysaccharide biosynthesis polyprenyl glycosylphosphotransferase